MIDIKQAAYPGCCYSTHSPESKEVRHHDEAYRNAGRVPTTIGPRRPRKKYKYGLLDLAPSRGGTR